MSLRFTLSGSYRTRPGALRKRGPRALASVHGSDFLVTASCERVLSAAAGVGRPAGGILSACLHRLRTLEQLLGTAAFCHCGAFSVHRGWRIEIGLLVVE